MEVSSKLASLELGSYTGHYSKGMMTLVINYISGNVASGYDLHKGLRRNLNGRVEQKGTTLSFELKEPGGNPTDGTFYLTLDSLTGKVTGKWVPTDNTKAQAGPVELARMPEDKQGKEDYGDEWEGDLGDLTFHNDGTCDLGYYPKRDSAGNGQLTTIRGNYEWHADTIRIEWQYNTHTPSTKMRLLHKEMVEGNDSTETAPPSLQGNGVKFTKNMAG